MSDMTASVHKQRGLSLVGTLLIGILLALVLLTAFRCVPVYNEYFSMKTVMTALKKEAELGASHADLRRSFERRAGTDDISSVRGRDLQISGSGPRTVINAAYERTVPLGGNVSLLFEFNVSSENL